VFERGTDFNQFYSAAQLLLMQEHGAWIVAQMTINGVGQALLGLLAFRQFRVAIRVAARSRPLRELPLTTSH
jgi:hypothetical protein